MLLAVAVLADVHPLGEPGQTVDLRRHLSDEMLTFPPPGALHSSKRGVAGRQVLDQVKEPEGVGPFTLGVEIEAVVSLEIEDELPSPGGDGCGEGEDSPTDNP